MQSDLREEFSSIIKKYEEKIDGMEESVLNLIEKSVSSSKDLGEVKSELEKCKDIFKKIKKKI